MPVPAKTRKLARPSARSLVFAEVRSWIEDGTLSPGEIIKDVEVAARLGVSRTPVREAFQQLEQVGAIETFPNHQTRVSQLNREDVKLVYPPLAALMVVAGETGTPNLTSHQLAELREANEQLLSAAKRSDGRASRLADERFHGVFIDASDNPYLAHAIDALRIHVRRLETAYFSKLSPSITSCQEHTDIIKAAERGDAAGLVQLVRRHYDRATKELV